MKLIHFIPALLMLVAVITTAHVTKDGVVDYQALDKKVVDISPFRANNNKNVGNRGKKPSMVGKKIPEFKLKSLYDKDITDKDLYGSLVTIWASWCRGCVQEHKLLNKLKEEGYSLYGINTAEKPGKGKEFIEKNGNPFIMTAYDPDKVFVKPLNSGGLPTSLIVDKEGVVKFHFTGSLSEKVIESQVKPILDEIK